MIPFNPFSAIASKIYAGVAIAALTFAAVQTVRIEGLKIWPLNIEGYSAANARLAGDVARLIAASKEAQAKAIAAKLATEARWRAQAKEADLAHATALESARSAVDRYAAGHRVRQVAGGSCSGPVAATETGSPGVPPELPADTGMVAISRTDLQDLADWVAFGVSAHNDAVDRIIAGDAVPGVGF